MHTQRNPWFHVPNAMPNPRIRLFCFPYAGGNAMVFHKWPKGLPPDVEVRAVQLPGRATRFKEVPFRRLEPLLDAIEREMAPLLDRPYAMFGHSMGALIAFELARRAAPHRAPTQLFVSGRGGPRRPSIQGILHTLSDEEFIAEVRLMNGTPDEVLRDQKLMDLVLPAMRADFEIIETWIPTPGAPLSVPIHAFGGLDDVLVPPSYLESWHAETSRAFKARLLPGGHFFLHTAQDQLLELLRQQLA